MVVAMCSESLLKVSNLSEMTNDSSQSSCALAKATAVAATTKPLLCQFDDASIK
jgi:L-cysteine desulfidase